MPEMAPSSEKSCSCPETGRTGECLAGEGTEAKQVGVGPLEGQSEWTEDYIVALVGQNILGADM